MRCPASARTCRTICNCARSSRSAARARSTHDFQSRVQAGADGSRLHLQPARAADHGALATRHVRQVLARLCDRQRRVPCPAALARPLRRAAAQISRDHAQRLQPEAGEPRARACREHRSERRAAHPAELSQRGRGPPRRRGLDPPRATNRRRARARALQAARISAWRRADERGRSRQGGRRNRHHDLPSRRHRQDGARRAIPWRSSTSACVCAV